MLRNTKVCSSCHSTEKACSAGAGLSASAIFSMASRCRVAFASAFSAASRAFFETLACHQENAAPTMVKTAHAAMTTFAADSKSSSSVRCGGCTASCGQAGVTHLTGEGAIRGADGSSSSVSSSAEGGSGLPGASAHTPAGHTVQVSTYKFLRRREDGSARS
nr:MAG TPA: hypothetical protein [Caudoviricetes sp.]